VARRLVRHGNLAIWNVLAGWLAGNDQVTLLGRVNSQASARLACDGGISA